MPAKPKPTKEKKPRVKKLDPDYWFSLCVRERAEWTCEACGKHYEPDINLNTGLPGTRAFHCSHYIGRANYAVRFYRYNANGHCYGCHSRFEGNPHVFKDWKAEEMGSEVAYNNLIALSNDAMRGKRSRQEKQQIAEHYQREFFRIRNSRNKDFADYFGG